MLTQILYYLQFPFVVYALITGTLIALSSSLIGIPLVLKRFSFIGDGLSHAAFMTYAIAVILKFYNNMFLTLPVTILFSLILFRTKNSKASGEAELALISSGTLGIGYLVMNIFAKSANLSGDVCSILFGSTSILTLKKTEVLISIVLALLVVSLFCLFYNRIFSITFDESFAKASRIRTSSYNLAIASIIAIVIVISMNLVGSLLISSLIIFPPLTAMKIRRDFKMVTIISAIISVIASMGGILIAILAGTPVGATIVAINVFFYIICIIGENLCSRYQKSS